MIPQSALYIDSTSAPSEDSTVVSTTQEQASWKYISFRVWRLSSGQAISDTTSDEEVGLVILSGLATIETSEGRWERIGDRSSVFEGEPYVLYLPPGLDVKITAETNCEMARCGSKASRSTAAYLIKPDDIPEEIRGEGNATRYVRHLLEADRSASNMFLVEVITPGGNWSTYPPHKHDVDDPPRETYLEETYYHRISPDNGFAFQRVYTDDRTLDESILVKDGALVLVPRGYHTVASAPGYDLYYLNVMAGPVREWAFTTDPEHEWIAASWKPYGETK